MKHTTKNTLLILSVIMCHFLTGQTTGSFTLACPEKTLIVTLPGVTSFPLIHSANLVVVPPGASITTITPTPPANTTLAETLHSAAIRITVEPGCTLTAGENSTFLPSENSLVVPLPQPPAQPSPIVNTAVSEQSCTIDHCLELDFCDRTCKSCFQQELEALDLKKGDFFTLRVRNVNPLTHSLKVTTRNDTFKVGEEPPILAEFLDIGKLSAIAANIKNINLTPSVKEVTTTLNETASASEKAALTVLKNLDQNSQRKLDSLLVRPGISLKAFGDYLDEKKIAPMVQEIFIERHILFDTKSQIENLADEIEAHIDTINDCYNHSVLNTYRSYIDCNTQLNSDCFATYDCHCLKDIPKQISAIQIKKRKLIALLRPEIQKNKSDEDLKKHYEELLKEIESELYFNSYFEKVHAKAYTNFLIANNIGLMSDYYSFPIQVQGDELELKIDIVPRGKPAKKEDNENKEEEKKESTSQSVTMDSHSPVTININTASVTPGAERTGTNSPQQEDGEDDKPSSSDRFSESDLKIEMPTSDFEWHLNYRYRINQAFYGFSAGFFVDRLGDEQFVSQAVSYDDPATKYKIVAEDFNRTTYGVMGAVNVGRYFNRHCDGFYQFFAGPGLSVEPKLNPRLLIGGGIGLGNGNKFSINAGLSIGKANVLSRSMSTEAHYLTAPEINYVSVTKASPFFSILYIFEVRKAKKAESSEKEKEENESKDSK